MKKIVLVLFVLLLIAGGVVFHFRYDIFQFSAESVIKKMLPSYLHVERILFDLPNGILRIEGLSIDNPKGFQNRYLATVDTITCTYRLSGSTLLDGIEITGIEAYHPTINIERDRQGRVNVNSMGPMMEKGLPEGPAGAKSANEGKTAGNGVAGKTLPEMVKIPSAVKIKNGKVDILDKAVMSRPYSLTFDNVNGNIDIVLSSDYTGVESASSTGSGILNNDPSQRISWTVSFNPLTPELTMSNRFEVSGLDITRFAPYYDRYSPISVESGRFSGTLVIDFDNGNIGSMNTIRLSGLRFKVKDQSSAGAFWDATVNDLIQYLETSPGDIVFDFKIKGSMQSPRFYPGPVVKQALQEMVTAKISQMIQGGSGGQNASAGSASDPEKVLRNVLQELMKK